MKKLLLTSLATAALSLASLSASAAAVGATAPSPFNVTVALTPVCVTTNATTPALNFTYTAFSANPVSADSSISLVFKCTKSTGPISAAISSAAGASTGGSSGTVGGLAYTLTLGSPAGPVATAGADVYTYSIGGSMIAGQAGDSAAPTSDGRILTVSY
jgi:spore coat protein U-like protein